MKEAMIYLGAIQNIQKTLVTVSLWLISDLSSLFARMFVSLLLSVNDVRAVTRIVLMLRFVQTVLAFIFLL